MSSILEVKDLMVARGKQTVLEVGALSVTENQVLGVIGPNGAGKSTLLLILSQALKAQRGEITVSAKSDQGGAAFAIVFPIKV